MVLENLDTNLIYTQLITGKEQK